MKEILIVGGGALGSAIARGLCHSKEKLSLIIVESQPSRRDLLGDTPWKIQQELPENIEDKIVIFAVKPQDAARTLNSSYAGARLIISVMGGILVQQIQQLTKNLNVVRAMPNLASEFGQGLTGLYATNGMNSEAEQIFSVLGDTLWLRDEKLIDLITALAASGPGVISYLMQYVFDLAVQKGLTTEQSQKVVAQMLKGTGVILEKRHEFPKALADRVTSPNGTTAAAINVLIDQNLGEILAKAFDAANRRASELSQILNK